MALDIWKSIPADKLDEVREAILALRPKDEGFTDAQWLDELVWRYLLHIYREGRQVLRNRSAVDLTSIRKETE